MNAVGTLFDVRRALLVGGSGTATKWLDDVVARALEMADLEPVEMPLGSAQRDDVTVALVVSDRASFAVGVELGRLMAAGLPCIACTSDATFNASAHQAGLTVVTVGKDERRNRSAHRLASIIETVVPERTGPVVANGRHLLFGLETVAPERRGRENRSYTPDEEFEGVIVHSDRRRGFALVTDLRRPPAMLHVRRMAPELGAELESGADLDGFIVPVQVSEIIGAAESVNLRQTGPARLATSPRGELAVTSRFLSEAAGLESALGTLQAERIPTGVVRQATGVAHRSAEFFPGDVGRIAEVRNRLSHGERVSSDEVEDALTLVRTWAPAFGQPRR